MGLRRRGRYPANSASAFDITRFSRGRIGGENFRGGRSGGGKETGIKPSLFFCFIFNSLQVADAHFLADNADDPRRAPRSDFARRDQCGGRRATAVPAATPGVSINPCALPPKPPDLTGRPAEEQTTLALIHHSIRRTPGNCSSDVSPSAHYSGSSGIVFADGPKIKKAVEKVTREAVLRYHSEGRPGKIEVIPCKPTCTQLDLGLAYTPGVAIPVLEIADHPDDRLRVTPPKATWSAVISNGTAILGLGNLGPLAAKPVMEGKGVLFKRFADIDVFDIEIDATDPDEIISVVRAIAPTFGGINLEDIKAPECFVVEESAQAQLDIPVFHDDQHGTAIIVTAGLLNALEVTGKQDRRGADRRSTAPARPASPVPRCSCGPASSASISPCATSTGVILHGTRQEA